MTDGTGRKNHGPRVLPSVSSRLCSGRWIKASLNSWHGLRHAAATEGAFREELAALALAIPLAFIVADASWERVLLVAVVALVLVVELLNTAIEKLADRVSRETDPQIGRVKDMGSAAVGLSLLIAGAIWLIALAERFALL
jgi:diacylglycerol kinase (ATP)